MAPIGLTPGPGTLGLVAPLKTVLSSEKHRGSQRRTCQARSGKWPEAPTDRRTKAPIRCTHQKRHAVGCSCPRVSRTRIVCCRWEGGYQLSRKKRGKEHLYIKSTNELGSGSSSASRHASHASIFTFWVSKTDSGAARLQNVDDRSTGARPNFAWSESL